LEGSNQMTSRLRRSLGILALTLGLTAGTALTAAAITGGTADGERHPNVVASTTVRPAKVATTNYLNAFAQPRLNSTLFTTVGYGTEVRKPVAGAQKPTPQSFPLIRRVAESPGQKLTPQILQVNGNINDTRGTGGACFGDSGGPTFHGDFVVTVTSYVYTLNCRYIGGMQRVDIPVVQSWLSTHGVTFG